MGLGKTMETCAFLAGMLQSRLAARVLIIAPKTLLAHWKKELATCGLAALTYEFYGSSQCDRWRPLLLPSMQGGTCTDAWLRMSQALACLQRLQISMVEELPGP
jgi:hypothetical protein